MRNKLATKANLLLWLGWLLVIFGLFLPVIHIPIPDPHMAPLLFLGLPIPNVNDDATIKIASHAPIEGIRIYAFIIITLIKKLSLNVAWLTLLLFFAPLLLAMTAPLQTWIKSPYTNTVLAVFYGLGLILPIVILVNSAKDNFIGTGCYFWAAALLMLCASRILVCVSSWKNEHG